MSHTHTHIYTHRHTYNNKQHTNTFWDKDLEKKTIHLKFGIKKISNNINTGKILKFYWKSTALCFVFMVFEAFGGIHVRRLTNNISFMLS